MEVCHTESYLDLDTWGRIDEYFRRKGICQPSENNEKQAYVPIGAEVLQNDVGTAPGLWLEYNLLHTLRIISYCRMIQHIEANAVQLARQILHIRIQNLAEQKLCASCNDFNLHTEIHPYISSATIS